MEYIPQPYESLTIMDLYCSVQDAYEEDDPREKRRARRRQRTRRRSDSKKDGKGRNLISPKASACRKKSSASSIKDVFKPATLRPRNDRRHSIAVSSMLKDGGGTGVNERRNNKSKKKSSGSDSRRKLSMVSQLKKMNIDCIAMRTRKSSQTRLSVEHMKSTRRHTCDYLPTRTGVLL